MAPLDGRERSQAPHTRGETEPQGEEFSGAIQFQTNKQTNKQKKQRPNISINKHFKRRPQRWRPASSIQIELFDRTGGISDLLRLWNFENWRICRIDLLWVERIRFDVINEQRDGRFHQGEMKSVINRIIETLNNYKTRTRRGAGRGALMNSWIN